MTTRHEAAAKEIVSQYFSIFIHSPRQVTPDDITPIIASHYRELEDDLLARETELSVITRAAVKARDALDKTKFHSDTDITFELIEAALDALNAVLPNAAKPVLPQDTKQPILPEDGK